MLRKCEICGREEDLIFNFVKLIAYYDAYHKTVYYICPGHGGVTDYDCRTGEPVELPLPQNRKVRNLAQKLLVKAAVELRYIWILIKWYNQIARHPIKYMRVRK